MKIIIYLFLLSLLIIFTGCKDSATNPVTNNYYYEGDSLSDPHVMPKVIFTNPANGAVGPFINYDLYNTPQGPQITIQFNKLINIINFNSNSIRLSTQDASYYLTFADYSYSDGYANPSLRNILIFRVSQKYLANKVYTVTVDTTLSDVHGYRLNSPYVFSYTPEPQFRVYSGSPSSLSSSSNGINPGSFSPITIDLNSKVDTPFFSKIQISPSVNGKWVFTPYSYSTSDSTTVYFTSTDTLLFDTKYTISVAGNAKDANGLIINAPYQFSFTTQPFQVILNGWSSYTGPGGFAVPTNLDFSFNGLIDTSTVRSSISITPYLSFDLSFNYSGSNYQYVYVNPNVQQMQRNTTYTITINNTVRSIKGVYLKNPYSYSITTGS
jgi:hypothetical protein